MYTPGTVGISRISRSDRSSLETYNMITEMTKIEAKDSEYFEIQRSPSCEIHGKKKKKRKENMYIYPVYSLVGDAC